MIVPRAEKAYEKHAWIILFALGIIGFVLGLTLTILPEPIDAPGTKNLTGATWEEIVVASPGAAALTRYFVRVGGIALVGFSILSMAISAVSYRKGERWAWYVLWVNVIILLGYITTNLSAGGSFWLPFTVFFIIALIALLLPYRKFFPRK